MNPLTTLYSGMVLNRGGRTELASRETVRFVDLIWAQPYKYGNHYGTLVLHSHGDFRFYTQTYKSIENQVCQFVGRLAKQGTNIGHMPKFPWVTDTHDPKR